MTVFHIEVEDELAAALRRQAEIAGTTPEAMLLTIAEQQLRSKEGLRLFLEAAKHSSGNATGWKWNREELYDR